MLFFKKKKELEPGDAPEEEEKPAEPEVNQPEIVPSGDVSLGRLSADIEKLKAQFGTFYELQKASTERFTRINEQIGELRTMLIERDKDTQHLEAKATQAIDLVNTIKPDKLMIELRKEDGKIEALRANLESNESIMHNIISELRDMRNKMGVFQGMEQVINMNEEVKKELMEIRKINAIVQRHADKVETMFSELQKRFSEFERFRSTTEELDKVSKQIISDVDSIKIKITDLSSKKSVENLITRFDSFEKHASNVISLLNAKFAELKNDFYKDYSEKMDRTNKLLKGFETLAKKTPDLDKYFNLLEEEAKKAPQDVKVEKVREPGDTDKEDSEASSTAPKEGMLTKLKEKFVKK